MNETYYNHGIAGLLKKAAAQKPDGKAYGDEHSSYTWAETDRLAKSIATAVTDVVSERRKPIAIYMNKCIASIASLWGTLYSGNFYCMIDSEMPEKRANTILNVLEPKCIITDREHEEKIKNIYKEATVLLFEDIKSTPFDEDRLELIYKQITENDPLYVLFTSGSTGIPKGVLVSQKGLLNYMFWLDEILEYGTDDVFGNQAPLYFDVSGHDIYGAAYFCATMEIIPEQLFSFPVKLIQYMNEKRVTTFMWVPSAMVIVAKLKTFRAEKPKYLRHVLFAGEVLPRKFLDYWMEHVPDAVYGNLYGPTETSIICTGHIYDGSEDKEEPLPIGKAVNNSEALILDEDGKQVNDGEVGELCIRGTCLALGYYRNPEKTAEAFVQNPLNNDHPETIYKTGDLVRLDEHGNIIYISRKDYQIKHMGYRIELGEIENAAAQIEDIGECACVYDDNRKTIVLFYDGKKREDDELSGMILTHVPSYMVPGRYVNLPVMPHNDNGKLDRKQLKEMI